MKEHKRDRQEHCVLFTRPDTEKREAENTSCTTQQNMTHFLSLGDLILPIHPQTDHSLCLWFNMCLYETKRIYEGYE